VATDPRRPDADRPVEFLPERKDDLAETTPDRLAVDTQTTPGEHDAALLFDCHLDTVPFDRDGWSVDEYTTVDALAGNVEIPARLSYAFAERAVETGAARA